MVVWESPDSEMIVSTVDVAHHEGKAFRKDIGRATLNRVRCIYNHSSPWMIKPFIKTHLLLILLESLLVYNFHTIFISSCLLRLLSPQMSSVYISHAYPAKEAANHQQKKMSSHLGTPKIQHGNPMSRYSEVQIAIFWTIRKAKLLNLELKSLIPLNLNVYLAHFKLLQTSHPKSYVPNPKPFPTLLATGGTQAPGLPEKQWCSWAYLHHLDNPHSLPHGLTCRWYPAARWHLRCFVAVLLLVNRFCRLDDIEYGLMVGGGWATFVLNVIFGFYRGSIMFTGASGTQMHTSQQDMRHVMAYLCVWWCFKNSGSKNPLEDTWSKRTTNSTLGCKSLYTNR